ncbi:calcium homeostasis endoplasmic reticulum protein isoform X2, partial [Sigmodon hispidus]
KIQKTETELSLLTRRLLFVIDLSRSNIDKWLHKKDENNARCPFMPTQKLEFYKYFVSLEAASLKGKSTRVPAYLQEHSLIPPLKAATPPLLPHEFLKPVSLHPATDEDDNQTVWLLGSNSQHLCLTLPFIYCSSSCTIFHHLSQQSLSIANTSKLSISSLNIAQKRISATSAENWAKRCEKQWMSFTTSTIPASCLPLSCHNEVEAEITSLSAYLSVKLHPPAECEWQELSYPGRDQEAAHFCYRSQCKQARELLGALQKVVVPIYCSSFLAVEEDKQQKIALLLQLWEKNGYFDDSIIQQLQSPALGLSISLAQQQQQQQQQQQPQPQPQIQLPQMEAEVKATHPHQHRPQPQYLPPPSHQLHNQMTTSLRSRCLVLQSMLPRQVSRILQLQAFGVLAPTSRSPPNKSPWFDQPHPVAPLGQQQPPEQPPYPHHQGGPPHCPPWNNSHHEGMWGEQRGDPGWNGQ